MLNKIWRIVHRDELIHHVRRDEVDFVVGMIFDLAGMAIDLIPEHGINTFKVVRISEEYQVNSTLAIDVHVVLYNEKDR